MNRSIVFSVVVPTYRRTAPLDRLLSALAAQEHETADFEVIVVDDGGGAPLDELVRAHADSLDIRVLSKTNGGPAGARNFGVAHARGNYLAFTDDDCAPGPQWLSALDRTFDVSPNAVVGGPVLNGVEDNLYSEATELLVDYLYLRYNPTDVFGGFYLANNLAVSRAGFLAAGGFDASMRFAEDREFCYRWAARGGAFRYAADAVVRHYNELRPCSFAKLHFDYGGGTAAFRARSRRHNLPPATISTPSWYVGLVTHGMRTQRGRRGLALSALLAASQICSVAGLVSNALFKRALIR